MIVKTQSKQVANSWRLHSYANICSNQLVPSVSSKRSDCKPVREGGKKVLKQTVWALLDFSSFHPGIVR